MHCTMDDLLALRAGEGSAWARSHAEACATCRAELDALYQRVAQLKALPARRPARDRWPAVREVVMAGRRRRRERWGVWSVAAAAAVAGLLVFRPFGTRQADAAGLAPQEPAPTPRPPRAARAPRAPRAFAFAFGDNHGRIGVVVRTDASAESDKVGAKIEGVTPGSPAEKAGLKVGDIITKFNSTALGGLKAEDDEESGPGQKLIALARELEPGDTVRLEYRRGSDSKQAALVG